MAVDRVVAEVRLAAPEPLRERRVRIVEHLFERLMPIDGLGLFSPELVALLEGSTVKFPVRHGCVLRWYRRRSAGESERDQAALTGGRVVGRAGLAGRPGGGRRGAPCRR